jgi:hypothetical protein
VPLLTLVALVVSLLIVLAGAGFATVRGLRAWRAVRRLQRTVGAGLREIARGAGRIESQLAHAGESAAELGRAKSQLDHSLAGLRVISAAAADVRATLGVLAFLRR